MTINEDITTQSADSSPAEPILDRNLYRTIKKMDKDTLQGLIQNIFEQGRQKGLSEVQAVAADDHTLDLRVLEKQIKADKGVGEKRAEEIMKVVEEWLGGIVIKSEADNGARYSAHTTVIMRGMV